MVGGVILDIREVPIDSLVPHEEIVPERLKELLSDIKKNNIKVPIIITPIGENKYLILDGHHRVEAMKILGRKKIPAIIVDYFSEEIVVLSWRDNTKMRKEDVIIMAKNGKKFPPKTTKHMIKIMNGLFHISKLWEILNNSIFINNKKLKCTIKK